MNWFRRKLLALVISAVGTIQALQILILPSWLDILTNFVILGLIALLGLLSRD